MNSIVSHTQLLAMLDYDRNTGILTWKGDTKHVAGSVAGCTNNKGYLFIAIHRVIYSAHALAWFYVTKHWAADAIDHINGNKLDNRFVNLRAATIQENNRNRKLSSKNKSGFKGVRINRQGTYVSRIYVDSAAHHLGTFKTAELAAKAYDVAAKQLFGNFALTNEMVGLI